MAVHTHQDKLPNSKFADLMGVSHDEAKLMIDRCHRGGKPKYYKEKNKIRPIYAAMMRWDKCEALVKAAREQNEYYIDYKCGPLTTIRRNQALKMRKEMKRSGQVTSAFLKFPALLMGKRPGQEKYEVIRDFSDDDVSTYDN